MTCTICDDTGWVCENHDGRPWKGLSKRADACDCGAGAPCLQCNPSDAENPPDMTRTGMKISIDKNGPRN